MYLNVSRSLKSVTDVKSYLLLRLPSDGLTKISCKRLLLKLIDNYLKIFKKAENFPVYGSGSGRVGSTRPQPET